jgi:hypothetical protein
MNRDWVSRDGAIATGSIAVGSFATYPLATVLATPISPDGQGGRSRAQQDVFRRVLGDGHERLWVDLGHVQSYDSANGTSC